jgi:heptosyltransferase I
MARRSPPRWRAAAPEDPTIVSPYRRILVIRLSAIGDVIMASGLIPALRNAYPQARLCWLTEDSSVPLLEHNPRLDQVFAWPRRRWRQLWRERRYAAWFSEVRALVRMLRAERFDLVLDVQGLLKSAVWAFASGGVERVGLGPREGSRLLMTRVVPRGQPGRSLPGKEHRNLVRALGLDAEAFRMDIVPGAQARARAQALLQQHGVRQRYAVIAPFTTRPQKHWFDERWQELAQRIVQEGALAVVMLGGPGDASHARAMEQAAPGVVNLTGRTQLDEAAAVIEGSDLVVGVDTGLTHLAIALNRPTLALFGSTRPYRETGAHSARVLYHELPCSPCRRRPTCNGEFTCMRLHTVDAIMAHAVQIMGREAPG